MSSTLPLDALASDENLCRLELAKYLRSGSLSLVLGSGVSVGMQLPSWWQLVNDCAAAAAKPGETVEAVDKDTPTDNLMRIMSRVERNCTNPQEYRDLIRSRLYKNGADDKAILDHKLLIVLGAMTMNSRRGSVSEVISFNFDDILERYLDLHGFKSQVVVDLPVLRRDADVTVYHPHGFLPSKSSHRADGRELIFSKYSFDRRLGDRLNPWQELLRDLLQRKVALFVGLTYDSATLSIVLANLSDTLKATRGPTGFWLVGPDDPDDTEGELLERNVVPLRMPHARYVDFLLTVCQKAGGSYSSP